MIRHVLVVLLGALAAGLACEARAADPPKCKLLSVAEWPVRLDRGQPVTDGMINGHRVGIMIDTGAAVSLLTKASAQKLDLYTRATATYVTGFGGDSQVLLTRIEELSIGDASVKGMRVRVGGERPIPGVDFIVGEDFLHVLDVEFDYAKGVIRLFQPDGCRNAWLAYWDPKAQVVPMEDDSAMIGIPVKVNGREARGMLDSGASTSIIAADFADSVGVGASTPGVVPASCASGVGADAVHSWVGRFDSVALGGETIRDPRLPFADFTLGAYRRSPEIILGTDFLRTHRVLVSRSQGKVYFSYAGGLVFPATPSIDCDERMRGKGVKDMLAAYDEALATEPNDTKARLNRAVLRLREKDAKGAIADLDRVIAAEPANAVALAARAAARAQQRDYDGALADNAAAIANGMRNAGMYVQRARYRRAAGDDAGTLREYDQALELDPHDAAALRGRGAMHFQAGRFDAAGKDFATIVAARPDPYAALWLAFARLRQGAEAGAVLGPALSRPDTQWPKPVLEYMAGRSDEGALMAAAADADAARRKAHECEARFAVAQRHLAANERAPARVLLERARDECPRGYYEYDAAMAELERLQ